jgi:DNA polymerase-3 subunit delta
MIYILSGQDDFSVAGEIESIKKSLGDPESLEINTAVLDGSQVNLEQLAIACETMPFLTDKRLVIIRGLMSRFEQKKAGRRKKSAKNGDDNAALPFALYSAYA